MVGRLSTSVLTSILTMPAISASAEQAVVAFTKRGTSIELTDGEQVQVIERVRKMMVGCAITSVSDPAIFADKNLAKEWSDTRAQSHLYVRFAEPVQAERRGLRFLEVAIGFEEPNFLGPELTRHGEQVVGHVKCSGHRALALMCATALRKHLSPGQERACTAYDRIGEPQ
jgi:hypothetical protein